MINESAELAIVGAGAAGLMTAISAGRQPNSKINILLLDSRNKIGAKILISGGTRCNVTNVRVTPEDYEGGARHFVKHVLEAFSPKETLDFFEAIGVRLLLEPTGKFFPSTHSGKTVLEALIKETKRNGVNLVTETPVTHITKKEDLFYLKIANSDRKITARRVILATGGLSYPETGSDGQGLLIAKSFGHSIINTTPALTPLTTSDRDWKSLSGITLNVRLSFFKGNKKIAEREGSFLFTHFGFSGPAALDISRFLAALDPGTPCDIKANFLPDETEETLKKAFTLVFGKNPGKLVKNFLSDQFLLPVRFVEIFMKKIGFDAETTIKFLSNSARGQLVHQLLNCPLEVSGVLGYKKAEVTAGGVDLKEVNVSTMESKIVSGLYFAGEILDIDGRIGGYNFQWAWSTGAIAGRSAMKSLKAK
ncbi:MAG: hypothetical protein AUJ72_05410 [Candidatus Omnitrophica bacterium CG1_02_46_14]|nr:MAG: hypothetical protein AUJ72_05410 [Candidatus Omnitrophica bacterium CG1_02_46_14]